MDRKDLSCGSKAACILYSSYVASISLNLVRYISLLYPYIIIAIRFHGIIFLYHHYPFLSFKQIEFAHSDLTLLKAKEQGIILRTYSVTLTLIYYLPHGCESNLKYSYEVFVLVLAGRNRSYYAKSVVASRRGVWNSFMFAPSLQHSKYINIIIICTPYHL